MENTIPIGQYMTEKQHGLLFLKMLAKDSIGILSDVEQCKIDAQPQLDWFAERGFKSFPVVPDWLADGWLGFYGIDVNPNDPIVAEYSKVFEDENGGSLEPEKYQMYSMTYEQWANDGSKEVYEQRLIELGKQ